MLKFIDLFAGIGGFHQALKHKGECVFASEIDERAADSYTKNHRLVPRGDIREVDTKDIPDHDILCGGFPCQPFSVAGSGKGLGEDRGNLFFEIIRIAKEKKPTIMILENVPHILKIDDKKVINEILKQLDNIGYYTNYSLLNASHYGVPQSRKRVYFVCLRKDKNLTYLPNPTFEKIYLEDILEKNPQDYKTWDDRRYTIKKTDCKKKLGLIKVGEFIPYRKQGYDIHSPKGHASTIIAQQCPRLSGGWYKIGNRVRCLTDLEVKRAMGFPDNYILSKKRERAQLGNAVIPKMIKHVFNGIK